MNNIHDKIKRYQIKQNAVHIVTYIIFILVILLAIVQVHTAINLLFPAEIVFIYHFTNALKYVFIILAVWLGMRCEKRLISMLQAASQIDKVCGLTDDDITNAYELATTPTEGNKLLINQYLSTVAEKITHLRPALKTLQLKRALIYLCIVLLGFTAQIAVLRTTVLKSYAKFYINPKPKAIFAMPIELIPGNVTISRGSSVVIRVTNPIKNEDYEIFLADAINGIPTKGTDAASGVPTKGTDAASGVPTRTEPLYEYQKQINHIDQSFYYYVTNQYSSSDTFFVNVIEPPFVKKLSVRLAYPAYLNKKTDFIDNSDGFLSIPQFTEIQMMIETPETVAEANLVFSDKSFLPLSRDTIYGVRNPQDNITWITTFTLAQTINYHFSLTDILGNENSVVNSQINIIKDTPPLISFTYPAKDTVMTQNALIETRLNASDDYGLKNLRIFHQINTKPPVDTLLVAQSNSNFIILSHILDFNYTALMPGDEVVYWAEVYDNSPLNQKAETPRYRLRFPSIEEIFREMERQEQQRESMLENTLDQALELQKEFDMKRREMLRKDNINWDDKQALEKFIDDQKALNDMIQNVADNYQQTIEQMQQNDAISQEMLQKMQKIQEIMESINSDELRAAMEKLQQSMEKMNPQDLRMAMENFQFNLKDFSEKIDQTLKLLQDIKNEQNLEKSLQIANEMKNMQEDTLRKTEDLSDVSSMSEQQQKIQEKLDALKEQMQKTLDDMQGSPDSQLQSDMEEMLSELENGNLSESLQQSSQALSQNRKQQAMQKQNESLSQMSQMISKLEQMKESMAGSGMQGVVEAIQATIYRMLMISSEHSSKIKKIGNDPVPFVPSFINDYESIQIAMNLLYQTPQVLFVLGQKFFTDLNTTINAYRSLFTDIQNSNYSTHKKHTKDIQAGINLIVFDLMQAMNNMQQGEGMGEGMQSLLQSLQQMSSQQMMMNTLTQSLLQQMSANGNRVSNQMRQQLQDIAADEQRIADNLKRLLQTNPEAQKHSNTLNELAREIEDVARKIRQNNLNQSLIDQQNRIMSRLLEVQRSINKRDNSNQRKGDTASDRLWELPPDLDLNFQNASERKVLEDEIQKLPLEYRRIILEYLRQLDE